MGIGMGVMQIPEEQRNNVRSHASASLERARDLDMREVRRQGGRWRRADGWGHGWGVFAEGDTGPLRWILRDRRQPRGPRRGGQLRPRLRSTSAPSTSTSSCSSSRAVGRSFEFTTF